MKGFLAFTLLLLLAHRSSGRAAGDEDSVVSVYTTLPTTAGTKPLDVYRQIAGNIAERITSPIYRFFGIGNKTEEKTTTTTKRPFEHIELGTPDDTTTNNTTNNNKTPDRDVEELSLDSARKSDKKPEKITLFSSYLPVKGKLELNDSKAEGSNDVDDDNSLELDDVDTDDDKESGREGAFIYFLELAGSIIQLLWGGFLALFKPSTSSG